MSQSLLTLTEKSVQAPFMTLSSIPYSHELAKGSMRSLFWLYITDQRRLSVCISSDLFSCKLAFLSLGGLRFAGLGHRLVRILV